MKSLIYKNPLISAIIINTISLIISIYSLITNTIWFMPILTFTGIANRAIIDKGEDITQKKRILILISFFIIIIVFLAYGSYIHNLRS